MIYKVQWQYKKEKDRQKFHPHNEWVNIPNGFEEMEERGIDLAKWLASRDGLIKNWRCVGDNGKVVWRMQ